MSQSGCETFHLTGFDLIYGRVKSSVVLFRFSLANIEFSSCDFSLHGTQFIFNGNDFPFQT